MIISGLWGKKRDTKNFGKRYDWKAVQSYYDNGNTWREVKKHFGMTAAALTKAQKRGDFKTRTLSEAAKIRIQKYGPVRMGAEARQRLSLEQSTKNRGGKSKWYSVSDQLVQGKWERNLAQKFDILNIKWIKLKTHRDVWPYVLDGKLKNYTPDFYLPDLNLYLEVKGYWWGNDEKKHSVILEQHSDKRLLLIDKEKYNRLLTGEIELLIYFDSGS
jgi:hypothetical protein